MSLQFLVDSYKVIKVKIYGYILFNLAMMLFYIMGLPIIYFIFTDPGSLLNTFMTLKNINLFLSTGNMNDLFTSKLKILYFTIPYIIYTFFYHIVIKGMTIYMGTCMQDEAIHIDYGFGYTLTNIKKLIISSSFFFTVMFIIMGISYLLMDIFNGCMLFFLIVGLITIIIMTMLLFIDLFMLIYNEDFIQSIKHSCAFAIKHFYDIGILISISSIYIYIFTLYIIQYRPLIGLCILIVGIIYFKLNLLMIFKNHTKEKNILID